MRPPADTQTIDELIVRVRTLVQLVYAEPLHPGTDAAMAEAKAHGMTYVQALEHVMRVRHGGSD